jgi:hypothetical protein
MAAIEQTQLILLVLKKLDDIKKIAGFNRQLYVDKIVEKINKYNDKHYKAPDVGSANYRYMNINLNNLKFYHVDPELFINNIKTCSNDKIIFCMACIMYYLNSIGCEYIGALGTGFYNETYDTMTISAGFAAKDFDLCKINMCYSYMCTNSTSMTLRTNFNAGDFTKAIDRIIEDKEEKKNILQNSAQAADFIISNLVLILADSAKGDINKMIDDIFSKIHKFIAP